MTAPLRLADFAALTYSHGGYPLTERWSQPLGARLAYAAYRLGLSPSAVTLLGAAVGTATSAAYAFAGSAWPISLTLMLAFQLAYALDCADGQLARATRRTSEFGAWLDVATDYVRYVLIGAAVLTVLIRQHAFAALPAIGAATAMMVGTVLLLHTTGYLQRQGDGKPAVRASLPRVAFRVFLDTPTFLLVICALRGAGSLLAGYAVLIGCVYAAVSIVLATRRLRRSA